MRLKFLFNTDNKILHITPLPSQWETSFAQMTGFANEGWNFYEAIRKVISSDWIVILDYREIKFDLCTQELQEYAEHSRRIGAKYPVLGVIFYVNTDTAVGMLELLNILRSPAGIDQLPYKLHIVKTETKFKNTISELLRRRKQEEE